MQSIFLKLSFGDFHQHFVKTTFFDKTNMKQILNNIILKVNIFTSRKEKLVAKRKQRCKMQIAETKIARK